MKKNEKQLRLSKGCRKKLIIMRNALIILLISTFQVLATGSYSQTVRLSLDMRGATIKEVLSEIETNSEFYFLYNSELIDVEKKINISIKNERVETILNQLFDANEIDFLFKGKHVVISPKNNMQESQISISGKATDESGETLPGVTVIIKGTTQGTITDIDGKYSLSNVLSDATLVFSFVGMKTQEIPVAGKTTINVIMAVDAVGIEEVVAIGYGTIRKSDLTGSVAKVKVEDASERAVSSVEQLLQGQISGVQITQNTGAAGSGISFAIRGVNSISSGSQPLIIIDGYPVESSNSAVKADLGGYSNYISDLPQDNALSSLNPSDIESVEILKDASSTAIYGSRAANGVVIVTTKRGKKGDTKITSSFRYDISQLPKQIDVLNTEDYIAYSNEAYTNDGEDPYYDAEAINQYSQINTNWQDLIYRTAGSKDARLNISGGNQNLRYAIMLGYLGQEGIVKNNNYDRGSFRVNIDSQVGEKFKFGMNVSGSKSLNQAVMQSTNRDITSGSVVTSALRTLPLQIPYNDVEEIDISFSGNPLLMVTDAKDHNWLSTVRANMFMEYTITKGLMFKVNGGANSVSNERKFYHPRGTLLGDLNNGLGYHATSNSFNYLMEYTLNFNRTFNDKHRINAVTGYTWQEWKNNSFGITAQNFPNDNLTYYDLYSASAVSKPRTRTRNWALASFIGRANYSFDGKYLLTFTGRYDGSTRLGEGNKWDFFPSVAVGWNVHNENFMQSTSWLSELKLRGSYGLSGNQSVGIGATKARLTTWTSVMAQQVQTVYYLSNVPNGELNWETTKQYDIGLDAGILDGRITFGFDYYRKRTQDLLINLTIPPSTGFGSYTTNQGLIENKGMEFSVSARVLTNELKWNVSGNLSMNRNKVIGLGDLESMLGSSFSNVGTQYLHIAEVGSPIGSFYGYRTDGIYQNQAEIDAGPVDPANPTPGSFKFKDISGPDGVPDGEISADYDREIIGNPYPDFIFGLSNNFSWKNISLSVLIQGSIGQDVINGNRFYMDALNRGYTSNVRQEAYDKRWTGEGTSNYYPKASTTATPFYNRFSDFLVEDASYIRLKNVTLSYTFNKLLRTRAVKLYVSTGNLLTITDYKGYDPEINSRGSNPMTPGVDYGSIPQYRSFSFGVNVDF